jgi:hypothetical protein
MGPLERTKLKAWKEDVDSCDSNDRMAESYDNLTPKQLVSGPRFEPQISDIRNAVVESV